MHTLLLTALLFADTTLVQTMKMEMNPAIPTPPGAAGEQIKAFAEPRDSVIETHGKRMRAIFGKVEVLYLLDTGKTHFIDRAGGRYATTAAGDVAAVMQAGRPDVDASGLGDLKWLKVKMTPAGEGGKGKSAGIDCQVQRHALTFVVDGQPPQEAMAAAMTAQRMDIEYCVAPVPAELKDFQKAQARMMELMSGMANGGGANPLNRLMNEPLQQVMNEILSKNLLIVQNSMRMYMDVKKMLPPGAEVPPQLAALADGPLITISIDTKSFKVAPVDASLFELPEKFKEVALADLDLMKLMAAK